MISCLDILNFFLFLLAISLTISNIHERFYTNKTTTHTSSDHSLINPAFDASKLTEVGYSSPRGYILGQSIWDKAHIGWAGFTEDGSTVNNVSGKFPNSTILERKGAVKVGIFAKLSQVPA